MDELPPPPPPSNEPPKLISSREYTRSATTSSSRPVGGGLKGTLGTVGGFLLLLFTKFKFVAVAVLKFFPLLLKTGGTMVLSMWVYALAFGWWFGVGMVVLIFIHECGHLVAARKMGLKVGAPVFIPFFGASIALKEAPKDAWIEAIVGIGGPIFGAIASVACIGLFYIYHQPIFLGLAYWGFFLNLFNLIPISPLDGGRIAAALSPWLWILGLIIIVGFAVYTWQAYHTVNFVIVFILISALPRVIRLFRGPSEADKRYFEVPPRRRWIMGMAYFLLAGSLLVGMEFSHIPVR